MLVTLGGLRVKVMRTKEMIANPKTLCFLNKFSLSVPKEM